MANQLSPYRKKISIALKVETVAKLDKRAALDNMSRAASVERFLATALESTDLTPEEWDRVKTEIEQNKTKQARG